MANPIYTQVSESEANDATEASNINYVNAGIDGDVENVTGQIDNWFSVMLPQARVVEFGASSAKKQNDFAMFTAIALGPDYVGVEFTVAWTTEHDKIY